MELYLYDFPVALRSEMDDLYKTVYELKKKVKSLEKQGQVPA
jgi:polyhydroxyalkanoate synthesis regulator phasin